MIGFIEFMFIGILFGALSVLIEALIIKYKNSNIENNG